MYSYTVTNHSSLTVVLGPGIGTSLFLSISVADQLSVSAPTATLDYLPPRLERAHGASPVCVLGVWCVGVLQRGGCFWRALSLLELSCPLGPEPCVPLCERAG